MKQLIIAEKPSLARKIVVAIGNMNHKENYYENDKYVVISVFGHLLTLWDLDDYLHKENQKWELEDLNFFPKKFKFKVKKEKDIRERYSLIKKLIARSDIETIVNAGDSDREGEVLVNIVIYSIFKQLGIEKKITRIWLEEQTESTIRKELNHQKDILETHNLYEEGLARTYIDWLYGIYLTRYISLKSGNLLPTGRVIIPSVKYVYDRYMAIKNFVPTQYYKIICIINCKTGEELQLDFLTMKYDISKKGDAQRLEYELKNTPIIVEKVENKEVIKRPKKLFSLATLQNYMNKFYKWSLKKTLNVLQTLYEEGYTTYPRTNTEFLANEEKEKFNILIDKIKNKPLIQKYNQVQVELIAHNNLFDSSKVESHSAITITEKIPNDFNSFTEEQTILYKVILKRCLANFCEEKCVIAETKITFSFCGYDKKHITSIKGQIIKQKGYLIFENDLQNKSIPEIKEGEQYYCYPRIELKTTVPPTNVTEKELNTFFENPFKKELNSENTDEDYKNILDGIEIGTASTRAETIEKIKKVGYVEEKKNNIIITEKGVAFINILNKLNINLWADKTAELSQKLKNIYKGVYSIEEIVNNAEQEIKQIISQDIDISSEINNAREVIGECPFCHKPVFENKKGYGCSGYKDGCKFVIWKTIAGKNITKSDAQDLLNPEKYMTKKKKGFISKNGKKFDAKLYLANDGSIGFEFN